MVSSLLKLISELIMPVLFIQIQIFVLLKSAQQVADEEDILTKIKHLSFHGNSPVCSLCVHLPSGLRTV